MSVETSGPRSSSATRACGLHIGRRSDRANRHVLEFALAALIANRAVERMVHQQEFHHVALRVERAAGLRVEPSCLPSPAWRRPARAWASSPRPPGTCGSWPRSAASRGSRSAGWRCRPWSEAWMDHRSLRGLHGHAVDLEIDHVSWRCWSGRRSCGLLHVAGRSSTRKRLFEDGELEFVPVVPQHALHRPGGSLALTSR